MTEVPKISVVVPTRNRVHHLRRMLDRILHSNASNFELVVVDGASTDGTPALLASYGNKIARWISEPDQGEYFAVNKGLHLATGDILKPMPDDDVLRPESLAMAAAHFQKKPEVDVLLGRAAIWQEGPHGPVCLGETPPVDVARLTLRNMLRGQARFHSPACFIRRRVFERIGDYATGYSCGDNEFWLRAMRNGVVFDAVPDVIYDSYRHKASGVETKKWELRADGARLCRQYGRTSDVIYALGTLYGLPLVVDVCKRLGVAPALKRARGRLRGKEW